MTYKLICSDIDGTLLNKDRALSKITISEVKRISPIPFILISPEMEGIRNSFPFSCAKRKELKNNRIKGSVL